MKRVTILANRTGANRETIQLPVFAAISSSISKKTLSEVLAWVPTLKRIGAEDADWDWRGLVREVRQLQREGQGKYELHVLRCQRQVQALMILESEKHFSRITGYPLVYLEYLAVAPWNRQPIQSPKRFSGCGSALIEFSIRKSEELGYDGRVGLHSLPGSRTFYARSGFIDLGADEADGGLHYFEYRG